MISSVVGNRFNACQMLASA